MNAQGAVVAVSRLADFATPLAIRALLELGVCDHLADGRRRTAEQLAEATGAHGPSLYRVLRALSGQGVFVEDRQHRFGLTPLSDVMRTNHPHSVRAMLPFIRADLSAWIHIDYTLCHERNSFELVHGQNYWDYLATHPETRTKVEAQIRRMTEYELRAVLSVYDWTTIETLVDLGGGTGQMLAGILTAVPTMRGVLFDLPHVAPNSLPLLTEAGVIDRCTIVSGDFFVSVPEGAGAYLLKRVFYDFDDDEVVAILGNVRGVIAPSGRILTLDGVARSDNRFDVGTSHDMFILPLGNGRCRTRQELTGLFAAAGFRLTRVIPTGIFPLVEGRPV
jgi:hypothetical protein